MGTLFGLALRNVLRHRARTAITLGAIAFGVFMSLSLGAFVTGFQRAMIDDLVRGRVGAIQVHRVGWFDARTRRPLSLSMEQGTGLEHAIASTPGVSGVTPRVAFSGLVGNGLRSTLVFVEGIDAAREAAVTPLAQLDVRGRRVGESGDHGAVLGNELAAALQVAPGATLTLQASTRDGKENAVDLDLGGTLEARNPLESKRFAMIPIAWAQALLRMEGQVTTWVVGVTDLDRLDEVKQAIAAKLGPSYEAHTWRELRPNVAALMDIQKAILAFVSLVFLVIAVIGIANTLLMAVAERTREIGTMMAVGVRRGPIALLFVFEAASLAVVGGVAGVTGALALAAGVAGRGGVMLQLPEGSSVAVVPDVPLSLVALAIGLATAGAVLAALYPANRAASLRPVEALRDA